MQDLKQLRRWMAFELTPQLNGTVKKRPVNLASGGGASCASCSDPSTWVDYQTARDAVFANPNYSLGFVLGKEVGLVVVDIDKARPSKDAPWPAWVDKEVEQLDSFDEVSVSGLGRHVWVWGSIPANLNRQSHHVEIHDSAKMFCVSSEFAEAGDKIKQRNLGILWKRIDEGRIGPDYNPGIVLHAYNSEKFDRAINDDLSDFDGDRSRAVSSVLWTLARKHDFDAKKMREEFEATALCQNMKPGKWDRVGDGEIERAITEVRKLRAADLAEIKKPLTFKFPKVQGADDEFILRPAASEFDGWFPRGAVSIIAGPSGAGKTTILTDLLVQQREGGKFLGHQGGGYPYLIIFFDRKRRSAERTLKRMGLQNKNVVMEAGAVCWSTEAIAQILRYIEDHKTPAVVFVEGADVLVQKPNDISFVAPFLSRLQEIAEQYHIALVLSVGSSKEREGSKLVLSRDNIFGSQVWGRMVDTVAIIKMVGDGTEDERQLILQHRDASTEKFGLEFANGRLVPRVAEHSADVVEQWAMRPNQVGEWFTVREAHGGIAPTKPMRVDSLSNRLDELVRQHKLVTRSTEVAGAFQVQYKYPTPKPGDTTGDVFGQATGS